MARHMHGQIKVTMLLPPRLDEALKRLNSALDQLDAAATRRAEAEAGRSDLAEELAVMQDDRSRLGVELDAALAQVRRLDVANTDARARLLQAAQTLRAVLGESHEGGGGKAA